MNVKLMLFLILSVFAVLPGTIFGVQFIDKLLGKELIQRYGFLPESVIEAAASEIQQQQDEGLEVGR